MPHRELLPFWNILVNRQVLPRPQSPLLALPTAIGVRIARLYRRLRGGTGAKPMTRGFQVSLPL